MSSGKGGRWNGSGLSICKSVRSTKMYKVICMICKLYLNEAVKLYKIKREREERRKCRSVLSQRTFPSSVSTRCWVMCPGVLGPQLSPAQSHCPSSSHVFWTPSLIPVLTIPGSVAASGPAPTMLPRPTAIKAPGPSQPQLQPGS